MATVYSLTCINKSNTSGSFVVFQKQPTVDPVAWLYRQADSGTQVIFEWTRPDTVLSTYWVTFGDFEAGSVIDPADLGETIAVTYPPPLAARTVTLKPDGTLTVT